MLFVEEKPSKGMKTPSDKAKDVKRKSVVSSAVAKKLNRIDKLARLKE